MFSVTSVDVEDDVELPLEAAFWLEVELVGIGLMLVPSWVAPYFRGAPPSS
jgi:hypothetical protein